MRRTAAEKYELIRLVEGSDLPVRQTLRELQLNRSTFYTLLAKLMPKTIEATIDDDGVLLDKARAERAMARLEDGE